MIKAYFKKLFIHYFGASLGLWTARGLSLVVESRGYFPVAVSWFLIAVDALAVAHGL